MISNKCQILAVVLVVWFVESKAQETNHDPCCSFPCQNFGICNRIGLTDRYSCDCLTTEYYGENCQTPTFSKWMYEMIRPSPVSLQWFFTNHERFWQIINRVKFLHNFMMLYILNMRAFLPEWPDAHNTAADYATWDGYANTTYYSRTLPAVPKNCPTPMGVAGPKVLPDIEELIQKVFTRTQFIPCPRGTSAILPLYGQHFTHQTFKSIKKDQSLTWGSHSLDLSHIYGETLEKQLSLRSMKGGKMKMQILNGEEYPPNMKDAPGVDMTYPPNIPEDEKFAMGHPFFALLPSLLYWSTLWLREHNRVCDVLAEEHPDWDDERLYQTTKLVLMGETLKITVEHYVQHVSGMYFQITYEPELLHGSAMRYASPRIHIEFDTLYHWHSMITDHFVIEGQNYTLEQTHFNSRPLTDHGMADFTTSLSNQVAGRGAGGRNIPDSLHHVARETLTWNRRVRMQPFNRYRQYFRLPPHKSFEELTGETKLAKVLSDLYDGDIDAVEFFVGVMVEKRHHKKIWGLTLTEAISPYSLRTIFSNTLGSPQYWRESTFGGKTGFDIIKTANLQDLVCRNIQGCPEIKFQIAESVAENTDMTYADLEDSHACVTSSQKTEL